MVSYFVSFVINCSEPPTNQLSFGSIEVFLEKEITSMDHVNDVIKLIKDRINSELKATQSTFTERQIVILNWNKLG